MLYNMIFLICEIVIIKEIIILLIIKMNKFIMINNNYISY